MTAVSLQFRRRYADGWRPPSVEGQWPSAEMIALCELVQRISWEERAAWLAEIRRMRASRMGSEEACRTRPSPARSAAVRDSTRMPAASFAGELVSQERRLPDSSATVRAKGPRSGAISSL